MPHKEATIENNLGEPFGERTRAYSRSGRTMRGPDEVYAHPQGVSPFGVMDMVGNVWQWTDEYVDEHTRGAILRGGRYYQSQGSMWYFSRTYQNDQHGKLLLMAPTLDRAGPFGFRCLIDGPKAQP